MNVKRVYEEPSASDGYRVLVDRLWPRGLSKERAEVDLWLKEIAPSTELRQWFHQDQSRYDEFAKRYRAELDGNPAIERLRGIVAEHPTVTLLYGIKDAEHNHAAIVRERL